MIVLIGLDHFNVSLFAGINIKTKLLVRDDGFDDDLAHYCTTE